MLGHTKDYPQRRIFICNDSEQYQVFKFNQDVDSAITLWWPSFKDTDWRFLEGTDVTQQVILQKITDEGKLTIHDSGFASARSNKYTTNRTKVVPGDRLIIENEKSIGYGIRHIATVYISKPSYINDSSRVHNRASDILISEKALMPKAYVFFAVPKIIMPNLNFSLDIEDMGDYEIGWNHFSLRQHNIWCLSYRTKYMVTWPPRTQAFYHDGIRTPIFIPKSTEEYYIEYRIPKYTIENNNFVINLSRDSSSNSQ